MDYPAKPRVLVAYPNLPHYRKAVFLELQLSTSFDFEFAADTRDKLNIKSFNPELLRNFTRLRNFWLGPVLWQRGLIKLVATSPAPVVVFLGDMHHASTWIGLLIARSRGKKTLLWTIGWHKPPTGAKDRVRHGFYRLAHHLLLYGQEARVIAENAGFRSNEVSVVRNSITPASDLGSSDDFKKLTGLRQHTIGAVIRLSPNKGLDRIISVAHRLREHGYDVGVLLVGSGPEHQRLSRLAERLGVPLSLPGAAYSPERLQEVYDAMAVTLVPKNVGLTAIQSLAFGVPVVTIDNPLEQMPEWECVVHRVTGSRVIDSDEKLADEVSFWLSRGRRAEDAERCKNEVDLHWTPAAQRARIESALTSTFRS